MSRSRQHINPRRDLVRFTDDAGKFHYFRKDRTDGRIDYRNPRSVMRRRGYYDLSDPNPGEHTGSVENSLQRSEEEANRVIDVLLDQISSWKSTIHEDCSRRELERRVRQAELYPPISLSDAESEILKCYIAWKFMRADRRIESETSALATMKKDAAMRFGQDAVDALDPDWLCRFARDTSNRVAGQGPSSNARRVCSRKGLLVSTAVGRRISPLVAGDNPVLKAIPNGLHLRDEHSEISMPASKDVVLSIYGPHSVHFNPRLGTDSIRHINEGTFFQSSEIACSRKPVLESLIRAHRKKRLYMQR